MDGVGKMVFLDGKIEEGKWRHDQFVSSQSHPGEMVNASLNAKSGVVNVYADDATIEVYADGSFVGNSPAKLKFLEGAHSSKSRKPDSGITGRKSKCWPVRN